MELHIGLTLALLALHSGHPWLAAIILFVTIFYLFDYLVDVAIKLWRGWCWHIWYDVKVAVWAARNRKRI